MHGVVVLAIFGFCLALALASPRDVRLLAVLAVVAGAGWPATLVPGRESVALGAVILAAALWVLAGLRGRRARSPRSSPGPLLVARRGGASTSAAVAKDGVLAWERWDPSGRRRGRSPSTTSGTRTTAASSSRRSRRSCCASPGRSAGSTGARRRSTSSTADRWLENPMPLSTGLATGRCRATRSCRRARWTGAPGCKQQVEVVALRDDAHRRRRAAGRARGAAARRRLPPLGRRRARLRRAPARAALHRLELRAAPRAGRSRRRRGRVPAGARPLPRHRPHARASRSAPPGRDARVDGALRRRALPRALAVPGALERGAAAARGRADAVRGRRRDRDLAARDRRLHLRRVAAARRRPAAARALRRRGQARLLPALRRRDGAHAPVPRHSRARRGRLHERQARGRRLDRHRPQRARLGRGLVPRLRLARVRPDARARGTLAGELQRLVVRIQRRRRGGRVRPAAQRRQRRRRERARPLRC